MVSPASNKSNYSVATKDQPAQSFFDGNISDTESNTLLNESLIANNLIANRDGLEGVTVTDFAEAVARYKHTNLQASMAYAMGDISNNVPVPEMGDNFKDARCCWYSLQRLKSFISLMEGCGEKAGIDTSNLGIRFYYGTYPGDPAEVWNPAYAGCHTLFLVPTYDDGKANIDFDPRLSAIANEPVRLDAYVTDINKHEQIYMLNGADATSSPIVNQGELCPPPATASHRTGAESTLSAIDQFCQKIGY